MTSEVVTQTALLCLAPSFSFQCVFIMTNYVLGKQTWDSEQNGHYLKIG